MGMMSKFKRLRSRIRYKAARGIARTARAIRKPAIKINQKVADVLSGIHAGIKIRPKFSDSANSFTAKKQAHDIIRNESRKRIAGAMDRAAVKASHRTVRAARYLLPAGAIVAIKKKLEED